MSGQQGYSERTEAISSRRTCRPVGLCPKWSIPPLPLFPCTPWLWYQYAFAEMALPNLWPRKAGCRLAECELDSRVRSWFASLVFGLSAVWASHGLAQWTTTVWEHSGSQMYLSAKDQFRQFRYAVPAPHLLDAGIRPGAILFDGRRTGSRYSGTAYAFASLCGAIPYAVAGSVSPDQRTVTLSGRRPGRDRSCRVVGYLDDNLVFKFSSSGQTSSNQEQARQGYTLQAGQSSSAQRTDIEDQRVAVQQPVVSSRSTSDAKSATAPSTHSAPIPRTTEVKLPVIPPVWEPYLYLGGLVLLLGATAIVIVILLEPKGLRHSPSVAPSTSPASVESTEKTVIQLPTVPDNPPLPAASFPERNIAIEPLPNRWH
jgi:hypothetical protein